MNPSVKKNIASISASQLPPPVTSGQPSLSTVPLNCKLPPSREMRLVSLEMSLVSLKTHSFESFLASALQVPVMRLRHDHHLILFIWCHVDQNLSQTS